MSADHYAILGVAPSAPPAVIRAAYLALMREYHPDRNPSPAAVERAQAIVAAYKVLGDFDRRDEYDWGRRRAREAAVAQAAKPRRKVSTGLVAAAAIGLAAVGAIMVRPSSTAVPPDRIPEAEVAKAPLVPAPKTRQAVIAKREKVAAPAAATKSVEPVRMALAEPTAPTPVAPKRAAVKPVEPKPVKKLRAPMVKLAVVEAARTKAKVIEIVRPPAKLAVLAKPPAKPLSRPVARPTGATELASLDQFVMAFYGQSWRFGDSKKRSALEQSRNGFVTRRGACLVDACKRAAYLRLQRDVSAIVESGRPAN